ncbi:MAG: hypothetical protein NTY38_16005 [Acidobacteria bacterium]|nr:hypothetical protein [Acidobacteriota bacterium]
MNRRTFLAASPLVANLPGETRSGYAVWSWERWREMTGETRPKVTSEQVGKPFLADLPVERTGIARILEVFLGKASASKPPLEVRVLESVAADGYTRKKLVYQTEPGELVPAYLLVPDGLRGKAPAVICPHQTMQEGKREPAGLAGNPRLHMAHELARRGYVTFTYDALCFGERHDPATGHRIGSIGHSHGGYTTFFSMALDPRLACGVSSCGFDTFRHDGNVYRWSHATALMPRLGFYISSPYISMQAFSGMPDSETVRVPFDLHEVLALIAPRPLLLAASDDDNVFPNAGWSTRQAMARLEPLYAKLGAAGRIGSYYFRGGHGFPPDSASRCYGWLDRWLRG